MKDPKTVHTVNLSAQALHFELCDLPPDQYS
jgi:hypothetical protein